MYFRNRTEGTSEVDLPLSFTIRESGHRIHNPFTEMQLDTLGRVLHLNAGDRILDLACGSGELLCTWAAEHGSTGTGVDISTVFLANAEARARELAVSDSVRFVHGDASGYVAAEPVEIAACLGASWIGDGLPGTVSLLRRSIVPGGMMLVGEPYWRRAPEDDAVAMGCYASSTTEFLPLPELLERFGELGYDIVQMVLADQDGWDRYATAQWLSIRRWLDQNPDDELAEDMRADLQTAPARHARYQREYLGWGVFALRDR